MRAGRGVRLAPGVAEGVRAARRPARHRRSGARPPGRRQPARQRGAPLAARRPGVAVRPRGDRGHAPRSRSATRARASRPATPSACSSASTAPTRPAAPATEARASVSPSRAGSSTPTGARSEPRPASPRAAGWWSSSRDEPGGRSGRPRGRRSRRARTRPGGTAAAGRSPGGRIPRAAPRWFAVAVLALGAVRGARAGRAARGARPLVAVCGPVRGGGGRSPAARSVDGGVVAARRCPGRDGGRPRGRMGVGDLPA